MRKRASQILEREHIRFLIWGGFNTVFGLLLFYFLQWQFGKLIGYFAVFLCSFVISSIISFLGYRLFVFKVRGNWLKDFLKFISVYTVPLIANALALPILVSAMNINVYFSQTLIVIFSALVSYFGHKYFSFSRKSESSQIKN